MVVCQATSLVLLPYVPLRLLGHRIHSIPFPVLTPSDTVPSQSGKVFPGVSDLVCVKYAPNLNRCQVTEVGKDDTEEGVARSTVSTIVKAQRRGR